MGWPYLSSNDDDDDMALIDESFDSITSTQQPTTILNPQTIAQPNNVSATTIQGDYLPIIRAGISITPDYIQTCRQQIRHFIAQLPIQFEEDQNINNIISQLLMMPDETFYDISKAVCTFFKTLYDELTQGDLENALLQIIATNQSKNKIKMALLGPVPHYTLNGYNDVRHPLKTDDELLGLFQSYSYLHDIEHKFQVSDLSERNFYVFNYDPSHAINLEVFAISDQLYLRSTGKILKRNQAVVFKSFDEILCPHCYQLFEIDAPQSIKHLIDCSILALTSHCGICRMSYTNYHDHCLLPRHILNYEQAVCLYDGNICVGGKTIWSNLVALHHQLVVPHLRDQFYPPGDKTYFPTAEYILHLAVDAEFLEDYYNLLHTILLLSDKTQQVTYPCHYCQTFLMTKFPFPAGIFITSQESELLCHICEQRKALTYNRYDNKFGQNNQLIDYMQRYGTEVATVLRVNDDCNIRRASNQYIISEFRNTLQITPFNVYNPEYIEEQNVANPNALNLINDNLVVNFPELNEPQYLQNVYKNSFNVLLSAISLKMKDKRKRKKILAQYQNIPYNQGKIIKKKSPPRSTINNCVRIYERILQATPCENRHYNILTPEQFDLYVFRNIYIMDDNTIKKSIKY